MKTEKEWLKEMIEGAGDMDGEYVSLAALNRRLRELEAAEANTLTVIPESVFTPKQEPVDPKPGTFGIAWDDDFSKRVYCWYVEFTDEDVVFKHKVSIQKNLNMSSHMKNFQPLTEPTWEPPKKELVPYILLFDFCAWLEKHGYLDTDWRDETPDAITRYLVGEDERGTLCP
jgi:hypothetical protein